MFAEVSRKLYLLQANAHQYFMVYPSIFPRSLSSPSTILCAGVGLSMVSLISTSISTPVILLASPSPALPYQMTRINYVFRG